MSETLRSSAKVSVAILASRVLGVARDSLFAAIFPVGALTDAYRAAFTIPNLLRDLFAEGALSSAFVPAFSEALVKEGKERAFRLGNLVLSGIAVVTGVLAILGAVFSAELVALVAGADGGAGKLAAAATLTRIMMPILTLVSLSAVFMGMLNAQRHHTVPAIAPALFNVVSILVGVYLVLSPTDPWRGLLIFSAGTTAAAAVQCFCQLPPLLRLGFQPRPTLAGLMGDASVRRMLRLMAPAVLGLAAIQINVVVNTRFAWALGEGPATLLGYAFRLFYLPIGLFGVALGTVVTTRVSEEAARGDRAALAARTAEGARAVWMLASAGAVGLLVLAEPIVTMLFEHGNFRAADTQRTVPIVQAYMLGVVPYSLVKVLAPGFYAVDRPRIPLMASLAAVAANLLFNAATYRSLGAPGLALGTTVAALVNFGVLRLSFARVVGAATAPGTTADAVRVVIASGALGVAVAGLWWAARQWLAHLAGAGVSPRGLGWLAAALLFATIAIGFALYMGALRLCGHSGGAQLARIPGRMLARLRPGRG